MSAALDNAGLANAVAAFVGALTEVYSAEAINEAFARLGYIRRSTLTQLAFMARTSGNPTPELIRACEGAEALIGKTMESNHG